MRKITKIIVHCSDSPDSGSIDVETIRQWHKDKGWHDIGYHYVVTRAGQIQEGRPVDVKGAHVKGENMYSIGVCWVGRNDITREAHTALCVLLLDLLEVYNLPVSQIMGHFELNPKKTCPNLNMDMLRELLTSLRSWDD